MCQVAAEELLVLVFGKIPGTACCGVYQPSARSLSGTAQASPTFSTVRTEGAAQVDRLVALSRDIDVHAPWGETAAGAFATELETRDCA